MVNIPGSEAEIRQMLIDSKKGPELVRAFFAIQDGQEDARARMAAVLDEHQEWRELRDKVESAKRFMEGFRLENGGRPAAVAIGGVADEDGRIKDQPHPDNGAAWKAIVDGYDAAYGLDMDAIEKVTDLSEVPGNAILFGGPNSTKQTGLVQEFEGEGHDQRRPEERGATPIIPLRYFGVSSSHVLDEIGAGRASRIMQRVGPVASPNWAVHRVGKNHLIPSVDENKKLTGEKISNTEGEPLLTKDYLIVTRMPNPLDPRFGREQQDDDGETPFIVSFDGMHGTGTRAVDLLIQAKGKEAMEQMVAEHGDHEAFQAVFEVDIEQVGTGGPEHSYHAPVAIRYVEGAPLPTDREIYEKAHAYAKQRMAG